MIGLVKGFVVACVVFCFLSALPAVQAHGGGSGQFRGNFGQFRGGGFNNFRGGYGYRSAYRGNVRALYSPLYVPPVIVPQPIIVPQPVYAPQPVVGAYSSGVSAGYGLEGGCTCAQGYGAASSVLDYGYSAPLGVSSYGYGSALGVSGYGYGAQPVFVGGGRSRAVIIGGGRGRNVQRQRQGIIFGGRNVQRQRGGRGRGGAAVIINNGY